LQDVTDGAGINFKHREINLLTSKMQRLLIISFQDWVESLPSADVNKDGNDDIFIGGLSARGQLFFRQG
jgi:hypothetical protein